MLAACPVEQIDVPAVRAREGQVSDSRAVLKATQEGTLGQPRESHGYSSSPEFLLLILQSYLTGYRVEICDQFAERALLSVRWPCPTDCSDGEEILPASQAVTEGAPWVTEPNAGNKQT